MILCWISVLGICHNKTAWTCWNLTLYLRRISSVDNFPTWWRTSTLGFGCSSVFGCNISQQVDWERWSDTLATTIAGYHPLDFFLWRYVKDKMFWTPVPDITDLNARITDAFATITEDVLENTLERNWLSIRRSACNKRSTCWSVLMCCKETSWVELHFEKKKILSWVTFWKKTFWVELHFKKKNLSWVTF